MTYCALVALPCALAALAIERVCAARRLPTRGPWVAAIALSLMIPLAAAVVPRGSAPSSTAVRPVDPLFDSRTPVTPAVTGRAEPPPATLAVPQRAARQRFIRVELVLAWTWLVSSLVVLCGALTGYALLERHRRRWPAATIDGIPVLISDRVGPAVIGFVRPCIVLPAWAARGHDERRRLVLAHEREHVAARDPLLLLFGIAALIATPWNLALWWQVRRLRLAIEIDCDARVLARHPRRAHAYGLLLLEMGRGASAGPLPLAAFSEPTSSLERRIRAMTAPMRRGRRHVVPGSLIAVLVVTSVAALPLPPLACPGEGHPRRAGCRGRAPPAGEMNVERHGPFPLGALIREHTAPVRVMLSVVESRHPDVHARGLPDDRTV